MYSNKKCVDRLALAILGLCLLGCALTTGATSAAAAPLPELTELTELTELASDGFRALPELRSTQGVLAAQLEARPTTVTLDHVAFQALTFNGDYGGPVLRVHPGDQLRLRLHNALADQPVNLHFHGSHASPQGSSDNMHIEVQPGKDFDYALTVPASQPPGLYWYHTHIHGQSESQINLGLSGAMIVEGIETRVPETRGLTQRLLVLKSTAIDDDSNPELRRLHGVVQSINGQAFSELRAPADGREFWRISNQAANDYFHLRLPGAHFRVVSLDGVVTGHDIPTDVLEVPPAGRMEVIVELPPAGVAMLLSGSTPTGSGRSRTLDRELARLVLEAPDQPAQPAQPALTSPGSQTTVKKEQASGGRGQPGKDLRTRTPDSERTFHFAQQTEAEVYTINGQTFEHSRIDTRVPLGSMEEWTIWNDTEDMHVFHIHQVHFQVVAINGQPEPFNALQDTVRVPEKGSITVRIPFTDPQIVGRFMYHCHVLRHEDRGMMANIEVFDPAAE